MPETRSARPAWWRGLAFALAIAVLGLPTIAPAQGTPDPAPFYRPPDAREASLSPSGQLVAVLLARNGRQALAAIDLKSRQPQVLAEFSDRDIRSFHWVTDDWLVFDLIDLQRGTGDQPGGSGLFAIQRSTGLMKMLVATVFRPIRSSSGLSRPALEANHDLLHVPQDGKPEVIVGRYSFTAVGDLDMVVPMRLDLTTLRTRSLALGMPDNTRGWLFDPSGEPRVAVSVHGRERRVHWRGPGETEWRLLDRNPALTPPWVPHMVDAEGRLYVLVPRGPSGSRALHRFDFSAGRPEPEPMVQAEGFDLDTLQAVYDDGPAAAPTSAPGAALPDAAASTPAAAAARSGQLLGFHLETDAATTAWLHATPKAWQDEADRLLPGQVNQLSCRRCLGADPLVLVLSQADRDPGRYFLFRPAAEGSQRWEPLARVRRDIDPAAMATMDFHRVNTRDGLPMPVWVTRPAADAAGGKPRPAVVLVHGGPWTRGGHWGWDADAQFLAAHGWVVIEPEFRGSTGYGRRWFRAGFRQWGEAMQDDLDDALQWAIAQGWVDRERVCIAGASYGGYAALMGPIRHPGRFRCAAAWVAVTEPHRLFETDGWSDMSEGFVRHRLPMLLGDPVTQADALRRLSVVQQVQQLTVPVLLAYGEQDRRVPIVHGKALREALTAAGRPPEWISYVDEAHGWRNPENKLGFARQLSAFLRRHLEPASPAR